VQIAAGLGVSDKTVSKALAADRRFRSHPTGLEALVVLRRSSVLLADGVSPAHVQEQLGHASIELTVGTYGRWLRKRSPGAVDRLDRMDGENRERVAASRDSIPADPAEDSLGSRKPFRAVQGKTAPS